MKISVHFNPMIITHETYKEPTMAAASDLEEALAIVEGERTKECKAGTAMEKTYTEMQIRRYADELLEFMGVMDDYITKPLRRKDLLAMVEKWISQVSVAPSAICDPGSTVEKTAPMDYERALDEFEHDETFLKEVLGGFLEVAGNQISVMHQAISDGDAETVRRASHAIKGGAANLTAVDLSEAAFELENIGKSGNLKGGAEGLGRLEKEFHRLAAYAGRVENENSCRR